MEPSKPDPSDVSRNSYLEDSDWTVKDRNGSTNIIQELQAYTGEDVTLPIFSYIQSIPTLVVAAATVMLLYHYTMRIVAQDEQAVARHSRAIKSVLLGVAMGVGLYGMLWALFRYAVFRA